MYIWIFNIQMNLDIQMNLNSYNYMQLTTYKYLVFKLWRMYGGGLQQAGVFRNWWQLCEVLAYWGIELPSHLHIHFII